MIMGSSGRSSRVSGGGSSGGFGLRRLPGFLSRRNFLRGSGTGVVAASALAAGPQGAGATAGGGEGMRDAWPVEAPGRPAEAGQPVRAARNSDQNSHQGHRQGRRETPGG